jgi:hypothetical protein
MGSGSDRPNTPPVYPSSSVVDVVGSPQLDCPDEGISPATPLMVLVVGTLGRLAIDGERVLMISSEGTAIAQVIEPSVHGCISKGFLYRARVVDAAGETALVRYWLDI